MFNNLKSDVYYEKILKVFSSYPGILNSVENLLKKIDENPYGIHMPYEIETHFIKYFNYYLKHPDGFEATRALFGYLIKGIHRKDTLEITLKSLLRMTLKLIEESTSAENHKFLDIATEIFKSFSDIDKSYLPKLDSLRIIGKTLIKLKIENEKTLSNFRSLYRTYLISLYDSIRLIKNPLFYHKELFVQGFPFVEKAYDLFYRELERNALKINKTDDLTELVNIPAGVEIYNIFRELHRQFIQSGDPFTDVQNRIVYFFWITENEVLSELYDFALREIGKNFKSSLPSLSNQSVSKTLEILRKIFIKLGIFFNTHADAVLFSLEEIGEAVYDMANKELIKQYVELLISIGFHLPHLKRFSEEYNAVDNRNHLRNLRLWFNLIARNPLVSKDLISSLSIYLFFGGVQIKDTDFFQRDITKLLNSDITSVFFLIKPILRKLPVYFNEINAEGQLRTVSTEVDEIFKRKDPLIHFIRKQVHVESSPLILDLLKETVRFWINGSNNELKKYAPMEIFEALNLEKEHFREMGDLFKGLMEEAEDIDSLLRSSMDSITVKLNSLNISKEYKTKALLTIRLYQLLYSKYKIDYCELEKYLKETIYLGLPDASHLIEIFRNETLYNKVEALLEYLEELKSIIVSPQKFEAFEDIAHKRHIAAGIPSVYGRYSERKFNALSVYLRLESLLNSFLDEIEQHIGLDFITRATLFRIEKYLKLFSRILELNNITSQKFINTLDMLTVALEIRRFTFSQYMDIFRNLSESVSDIVNTYCTAPYKKLLRKVISIIFNLTEKSEIDSFELINTSSEKFLRDIVMQYPGINQLDRIIGKVIKTAYNQAEKLSPKELDLLMTYDPKKILCDIYSPRKEINDRIHLGNKGHNLIKLATKSIPVPPGFIITTEVFRCREVIKEFEPARKHLEKELKDAISRLEALSKREFSNPLNPLLVSVRSGGAISMPGMMNSFLNVGINEEIAEGLGNQTGKHWFVWDSYRRFLQCWGMSFGLDRDEFDNIMNFYKKKHKVDFKIQFSPAQMREVALAYKEFVVSMGIKLEEDPWKQITIAVNQVLNSWYSEKARAYREILGISEDWGTAVVIQKMVFGNLDINSGSGVLFTRNPKETSDRLFLWGDYTPGAQGEDIVSGLVNTFPISIEQKNYEGRFNEKSLEEAFPEIYRALFDISERLIYDEKWDHQEIEFTFEGRGRGDLYILQTREMSYSKGEMITVFLPSPALNESKLGTGIGVSGGALSGRVVFDIDDIKALRQIEPETSVILVRADTVPDDIVHIAQADGILTARGGSTSHASIIATKLGKTCVVGFSKMIVHQNEKKCKIGKRILKKGDFISIDGRSGLVYSGRHETQKIYLSMDYI
ncbi:PEP/pyruvate-binding domain-containing protein [Thermodesulfovibrio sp.]|uniref:PEP/pyruvate-binding domain-containing protein n=1 Tax=Thermodesulfovibrio sp. TaxID=2067987 RepID=UPI0030B1CA9D